MQFTSVYSRRWSLVWAGAVPHDRASFWVVQSCVSSLQQCAPVKNLAFPKASGKPEGGKCRHGGRGCCLSPLCPACPDPLGFPFQSSASVPAQGAQTCVLGTALWRGLLLAVMAYHVKLFELWVPWGEAWWSFLLFSFCTKWYREAMRLRLSALKQALELAWVWMGQGRCLGSTDSCRGIYNQRDLTELWLLRSALNCDSDHGTITSYQMNQQERSLSLAQG